MALPTLLVIFITVIGIWAKSIPLTGSVDDVEVSDQAGNRLVFAHFMV